MSKLRESAKGQPCMVRIPGVCNGNQETTVLAHLNGGGMGLKDRDVFGSFACSACHDIVDFRVKSRFSRTAIRLFHHEGMVNTQRWWLENGYKQYF